MVTNLRKSYGGVVAVDDCSFGVESGITCLIGPNGAGKSSVAAMISGEVPSDGGYVLFEGRPLTGPMHSRVRAGLARTFQLPQELARMTVLENLVVAAPNQRGARVWTALAGPAVWGRQEREILAKAWELLTWCGLRDKGNDLAGSLSGGQKKLLELARALMCEPRLVLLDEPMAGVAPHLADRLMSLILALRDRGLTLLIIEHEMKRVERLSDSVVVMSAGTVLATGAFAEVRARSEVKTAYLGG
jgi:branched-chain amino acid transport system ATP-binding protein